MKGTVRTITTLVLIGLSLTAVSAIYAHQASGQFRPFLFKGQEIDGKGVIKGLALGITMLVGICCGHFHAVLLELPEGKAIRPLKVAANAFKQGSFWRALVAAPLLFGAVYGA